MAMATEAACIGATTGGSRGSEDRVLATAAHILKSMNAPKEVHDDMLSILSSYDNRLSNITDLLMKKEEDDEGDAGLSRFEAAEKVINRCVSDNGSSRHSPSYSSSSSNKHRNDCTLSLSFEDSPDEAFEFLSAVDKILALMKDFSLENNHKLLNRADSAIQIAMSQLEDEFRHILFHNSVPFDADRLYGSARRVSLSFAESDLCEEFGNLGEFDNEGGETRRRLFHEKGVSLAGDLYMDLINPTAVLDLKEISQRMIRSGYEKECVQVYESVRREALVECLMILGVEKLSIEEMQKIVWKDLDEKMKRWICAIKMTVRVIISGEMRLCDEIFGDSKIKNTCFNETVKPCIMQLLHFGEAVAIGRRSSEKLFRILDMYDALGKVLQNLQTMVTDESVCNEAKGVLAGLGDAARGTLVEFGNNVLNETSKNPIKNGGVHPMVRYVMNYLKLVVDYADTLNGLLVFDNDMNDEVEVCSSDDGNSMSLLAKRLLRLITYLESNIREKSKLCEDGGLQYIFLMNNVLYIVDKVKDSELGELLGDDWIKKRRGQIRQYSTSYLRASWLRVLSCLRDHPISPQRSISSSNASKTVLKDKFKSFNSCFEELYTIQTAWKVPDDQLREELRISISENVITAYRAFFARNKGQLEGGRHAGKYIKYTPDDLEHYLLDLFEGKQMVIRHSKRRSL